MSKVPISEVKPGMVAEKPVYSLIYNKLLLTYGTRFQESMISNLKSIGIKELEIADPYTIFVKPIEKMAVSLKDTYDHVISKYSSAIRSISSPYNR